MLHQRSATAAASGRNHSTTTFSAFSKSKAAAKYTTNNNNNNIEFVTANGPSRVEATRQLTNGSLTVSCDFTPIKDHLITLFGFLWTSQLHYCIDCLKQLVFFKNICLASSMINSK